MRPSLVFGITFLFFLSGDLKVVDPVWAAPKSLQDKIKRERSHLQQLKQEIQETKQQRQQTEKEHDAVLQSVETLDRNLYQERKEYDAIRRKIRKVDREQASLNRKAAQVDASLQKREHVVKTRLRRLYMEGHRGWFRPLMSSDSYSQFQSRLTYLSSMASWEQELLSRYEADKAQFDELKKRQARVRQTLLRHKKQIEKNMNVMKGIKGKKQVMLTSLKRQTRSHEQTLSTLHHAEERKESLLDTLRQSSEKTDSRHARRAVSFLKKGRLLWPADGPVVAPFGRQKHPRFNTFVNKKGIEIQTRDGSAIKAVFGGNVVFADWLKGYGLVVILDHHNGFFSFYAHASKLGVTTGDDIASGEILGHTGASGLTDKSILYFELRQGTQPVDPQKWLVKR